MLPAPFSPGEGLGMRRSFKIIVQTVKTKCCYLPSPLERACPEELREMEGEVNEKLPGGWYWMLMKKRYLLYTPD